MNEFALPGLEVSTRYRTKPTKVLHFGGGQDSTAILYKLYYDPDFYQTYVGDAHLVVIMASTGNEWPATMLHVGAVKAWCARVGIEFYFLTPDMGYHSRTWPSLKAQMERNDNLMAVWGKKSCTDQLKIQVCYRFLGQYLNRCYGYRARAGYQAFYAYQAQYGKLEGFVGLARGEERRRAAVPLSGPLFGEATESGAKPDPRPRWMVRTTRVRYPLIELGLDRQDCQQLIRRYGHSVPIPSNCMPCPFQNEAEIVYLYRAYPDEFYYWVSREQAKLAKCAHKAVNLGVKGKRTLPEYLTKALQTYGTWSVEQLAAYRFSHGHCVKSKF